MSPQIAGISGLDSTSACGLSCSTTVSSASGCGKCSDKPLAGALQQSQHPGGVSAAADECRQANDVDADSVQDMLRVSQWPIEARGVARWPPLSSNVWS